MVGGQPALGHRGPASKRNHGQQVVQHPARACLRVGGAEEEVKNLLSARKTIMLQVYLKDYGGEGSVSLQSIRSGNPSLGAASQLLHRLADHPPEPVCHQSGRKVTSLQSLRRVQWRDGTFPWGRRAGGRGLGSVYAPADSSVPPRVKKPDDLSQAPQLWVDFLELAYAICASAAFSYVPIQNKQCK